MRIGCIYTLNDPETGLVRYVGQTIVPPNNRYAQHIYQWKRSLGRLTHVNAWIKSLFDRKLKPLLEIVEDGIPANLLGVKEIEYIKMFKAVGAKLCNHSIGGKGTLGCKPSEDSKRKRLDSLSKSQSWKEKHIRHSEIMRERVKSGKHLLGYNSMSPEKRVASAKKASETLKRLYAQGIKARTPGRCVSVYKDGKLLFTYSSIRGACAALGDLDSGLVCKVCKGVYPHAYGYVFKYCE